MPQALSADEFLPCSRDIAPVQRGAGLDRADQGYRVARLDPGPTEHGACFSGQGLGLAPLAVGHRHQRLLAQRDHEHLVDGGLLLALTISEDVSPSSR